jgi:hypothetical protein
VKIACVIRRGVAGKGSAPAETSPATYPAEPASQQPKLLEYQEPPVNTDDLEYALCEAERRVLKIQTKLHRWL